jgi:peroxiredoxin Q/BCP
VCSLRDVAKAFEEQGVQVFGVSLDSVADQKRFHREQELNFRLLSDPDGSAATKLGVLPEDARWTKRVTFVIDGEGVVRAIDDAVRVATHGEDLVALLESLED